jgi:hypothetical protein
MPGDPRAIGNISSDKGSCAKLMNVLCEGCLLIVRVACSVVCRRAAHGVRLCVLPILGIPMAHPLFLLSALHVGALQGNKEPSKIISDRHLR